MRVYICGPITGHEADADARFRKAAVDVLRICGNETEFINPLIVGKAANYAANLNNGDFMQISYTLMKLCDAIYMMDGWDQSNGCRLEWLYAQILNLEVVNWTLITENATSRRT